MRHSRRMEQGAVERRGSLLVGNSRSLEDVIRDTPSVRSFLDLYRFPFLVVLNSAEADQAVQFATALVTPEVAAAPTAISITQLPVVELKKCQGRNAFADMITLGRAKNNDIVVHVPEVSKFHAYFTEMDGVWRITDARSTNGTFVNGVQLKPHDPKQLASQDQIKLGESVALRFVLPVHLYELAMASG